MRGCTFTILSHETAMAPIDRDVHKADDTVEDVADWLGFSGFREYLDALKHQGSHVLDAKRKEATT